MKVKIDYDLCMGDRNCNKVCPQVFQYDEDQMISRIASCGSIHGPPAIDQPGQFSLGSACLDLAVFVEDRDTGGVISPVLQLPEPF